MTAKTTVKKAAEGAKIKKTYKVTCGHFEKKKEALDEVSRANKKGYKPTLIVNGKEFSLVFGEYETEQAAQETAKALYGAGFETHVI